MANFIIQFVAVSQIGGIIDVPKTSHLYWYTFYRTRREIFVEEEVQTRLIVLGTDHVCQELHHPIHVRKRYLLALPI